MSAPVLARRIRSSPSRSAVPGAIAATTARRGAAALVGAVARVRQGTPVGGHLVQTLKRRRRGPAYPLTAPHQPPGPPPSQHEERPPRPGARIGPPFHD